MTQWYGPCKKCGRKTGFLALLPGTHIKACVRCYVDWRKRRGK